MAAAEGEEPSLELAARPVGLELRGDRQTEEFRLPECRGELRLGKSAAEVGQRPRGGREWDAVAAGDLAGEEGG